MTVLRASSLAAVTILVWSTRPKASSWASLRTSCRARTTSCSVRTGRVSVLVTDIAGFPPRHGRPEALHPALDVEGRVHAGQGEAQLDEGDRDGRAHADDDRAGVEDAGHGGDVGDHAADERVDHLEGA